ncbi:MAG: cell division protein ZapB, partial [Deltaproteobacteria bacterium]|nr:cell division protein ZapB [Deltaproteobacteria bacterium]
WSFSEGTGWMDIEKLSVLETKVAKLIDETLALRNEKLRQEKALAEKEEEIRTLVSKLEEIEEERGFVREKIEKLLVKLENV